MKNRELQPIEQTSPFDGIRQVNEQGREYWSARDLQRLLEYTKWEHFEEVIEKAMAACKNVGHSPSDHFPPVGKMIKAGKGAAREVKDYHLTRYACYLTAMNGDPRKSAIAQAQTYFAIKTREAEQSSVAVPAINSLWDRRLSLFGRYNKIPPDYWCVFGFVAGNCYMEEFRDVRLVAHATPDGSIGKMWCQHLRSQGYDMSLIKKYRHRYPDHRGEVWANIYPSDWLGEFWLAIPAIIKSLHTYHRDFSIDSTFWLNGCKFGEAIDARGRRWPVNGGGFDWSKEAILQQNVRTMSKWVTPTGKPPSYGQGSLWEVCNAG